MTDTIELPANLSRREFLHLGGLGLLSLAVPLEWARPKLELPEPNLGRVLEASLDVYRDPSFSAIRVFRLERDEVIQLIGAVVGDRYPEHNRIWYEADGLGFVHSSSIQPVRASPNQPLRVLPRGGTLMEVTIPYVDAYWETQKEDRRAYRFYYETVHWVDGLARDKKDRPWYRLYDDRIAQHYFVPAEALRHIDLPELTPISPEVPVEEKRIEVDLAHQWIQCFEGSTMVFTSKVSTGARLEDGDYWTPPGDFITFRKRGSRHMAAGNLASGYDLPGVPWVSYITQEGISFHGTYWHNDFGTPRSHGCINMTPQAAKWVFRWTHPLVPTHMDELWSDVGTAVTIHA